MLSRGQSILAMALQQQGIEDRVVPTEQTKHGHSDQLRSKSLSSDGVMETDDPSMNIPIYLQDYPIESDIETLASSTSVAATEEVNNFPDISETLEYFQLQPVNPTDKPSEPCRSDANDAIDTDPTNYAAVPGPNDDANDPYEDSGSSYNPEDSDSNSSESSALSEVKEDIEDRKNRNKRGRKSNPSTWHRAVVKKLRLSGKPYKNRSGKEIGAKISRPVDCSKCRYKCNANFPEGVRNELCAEYWGLADYTKQKIHLSSLIQNVPVKRKKVQAKNEKKTSRIFWLNNADGERLRVCLKFFCATFSISHRVVELCMQQVTAFGLYVGQDKRRGILPRNATPDVVKSQVREHIDRFPRMESHSCRRDSKKLYLPCDLNLSLMYRLYVEDYCTENNIRPVSKYVYQTIFHQYDPPLSFYVPKKDQCFKCNVYNTSADKTNLQDEYEKHKQREKDALQMKAADKERAAEVQGETFRAFTFDLQAILSVPYAGDNQIYYKSKLNVYNFTIFDSYNRDGYCFVWDECNGKKGSAEIGTCLLRYLFNLPASVEHVASFCDTCGGQNRNKNIAAAMLYAVNNIDHLQIVDLKFMETGHSFLEADSMHATIERARKHKKIYTTREWAVLISAARIHPRPYHVSTLTFNEFYNLEEVATKMLKNTTLNVNNEKVQWLKIKWLRFDKSQPSVIQYKYNLYDEHFMDNNVSQQRGRNKGKDWSSMNLLSKYAKILSVSEKKKKDLLFLLKKLIIPKDYEHYFTRIPTAKELNPESDYSDDEDQS